MKDKTQRERVIKKLLADGEITRNQCLRVFISRLGAIICDLKKDGWDFETKNVKGDYVYKVTVCPFKRERLIVPSIGKVIERYVEN